MENTKATQVQLDYLARLDVEDVLSVYSGKPGCACGCRGNHRYNSAHVKTATKRRGYQVTKDEVSDRSVARILRLIQLRPEEAEFGKNNIAIQTDTRLYIVYPLGAVPQPDFVLKLVHKKTKKVVVTGERLKSGQRWFTVTGWEEPRHINSSGRVYVQRTSSSMVDTTERFFPHVFGLEFAPVKVQ